MGDREWSSERERDSGRKRKKDIIYEKEANV